MKNIKVIATDLDGTLFNAQSKVGDYTANVLKKVIKKGYRLIYATARPFVDVKRILPDELLIDQYIIAYNGAHIVKNDQTIYSQYIAKSRASGIIKDLIALGYFNIRVVSGDKAYSNFDSSAFIDDTSFEIVNYDKFTMIDIHKILVCDNCGIKDAYVKSLLQDVNYVLTDDSTLCQIMPSDVDKWSALRYVINQLNLTTEQLLAFGNDNNDRTMLQNARFSGAPLSAQESIKEIANVVVDHHNNQGVAKYIDTYLL